MKLLTQGNCSLKEMGLSPTSSFRLSFFTGVRLVRKLKPYSHQVLEEKSCGVITQVFHYITRTTPTPPIAHSFYFSFFSILRLDAIVRRCFRSFTKPIETRLTEYPSVGSSQKYSSIHSKHSKAMAERVSQWTTG